jgi:MFS family permease
MGSLMGLLALAHSLGMLSGPLLAGISIYLFSFETMFFLGATVLIIGTIVFSLCQQENKALK